MARILIVDDSPTQVHSLSKIVEGAGHEALTADDAHSALETARTELPDLILMDVVLPEISGFQATRELSRGDATSRIPVVMVTTKDQPSDEAWALRQGAKAYITKPVEARRLLDTIDAHLTAGA